MLDFGMFKRHLSGLLLSGSLFLLPTAPLWACETPDPCEPPIQVPEPPPQVPQPPPQPPEKPAPEPKKTKHHHPFDEDDFAFAAYASVGGMSTSFKSLTNALFETCSNCPLAQEVFSIGGGSYFLINPLLFEFEGQVVIGNTYKDDNFSTTIGAGSGFVNIGLNLSPFSGLRLYPLLGIGLGMVEVRFANSNRFPSFAEFVADPGRQGSLTNLLFLLNLGLGLDMKFELFDDLPFLLGLRAGFIWSPVASSDWTIGNTTRNVKGGPSLDFEGPYLRFMVGF